MTLMKLSYLFSLFLFLTSCRTNVETSTSPDSVQIFKTIINGSWYLTSYMDSIRQTKSPLKAQESLQGYAELNIDTSKTEADSLEIWASDFHEASGFFVYFRPGLSSRSMPTNMSGETADNSFELGYNTSGSDTSLVIFHYNKKRQFIEQMRYKRVPKNSE